MATPLKTLLKNVGIKGQEVTVYLASLRIGAGTVTDISHAAKLPRTTTKSILERLMQKGFVTEERRGHSRVYWIEDPEALYKREEAKLELYKELSNVIGDEYFTEDKKPYVVVHDTRESVVNLTSKVVAEVRKNGEILTLESPAANNYQSVMTDELFHALSSEKRRKGIRTRSLIPSGQEKNIREGSLQDHVSVRSLPPGCTFTVSVWVFGSSLVLFSGKQTFAVRIRQKDMHISFQNIFDFLWNISKPLT